MIQKILSSILLICLTAYSAIGQNDYNSRSGFIVTMSNDTIQGKLKENSDVSEQIHFRKLNESTYSIFTPDGIKAFSFEHDIYLSVEMDTIDHAKKFLLSLVEGNLSLFKMKESFVLQKKNGPLVEISRKDKLINNHLYEDKKYIGVLKFLTSDEPQLIEKINKTKFSTKELIEVVSMYNERVNPKSTKVINRSSGLKIQKGFIIGFNLSSAKTKYKGGASSPGRNFNARAGYMIGGWMKVYLSSKAGIQPEINIVQKNSSSTLSNDDFIKRSMTYLEIPVSFHYEIPFKNRPSVSIGILYGYALKTNSYLETYDSYNQKPYKIPFDVNRSEYGLRAGISLPIGDHFAIDYLWERTIAGDNAVAQNTILSNSHMLSCRFKF